MVHDNKVVSFSGQKPPARFALPAALVRLRDASGQSLKSVLASFFDRADDALFELADRAGSNLDQTAYFDAMRESQASPQGHGGLDPPVRQPGFQ